MECRIFARSDTAVQPVPTRFSTCRKAIPNHVIVPTRNKSVKQIQRNNLLLEIVTKPKSYSKHSALFITLLYFFEATIHTWLWL
jgi:hypothetical protein